MGAGMTDEADPCFGIGEVAEQAGVSTRTLRYYQELGLLDPTRSRPGGRRRYSARDVARLGRILELRDVMGFDLDRINAILYAEDHLAALREEVLSGVSLERHKDVIIEAITINNGMRAQVADKLEAMNSFLTELETNATKYREIARDLNIELAGGESVGLGLWPPVETVGSKE
jgi:MerR family transcriptional regulator, repressor of the yfmOP operon